jgi:glycosyltransferase involved in cell wall biosynthesis
MEVEVIQRADWAPPWPVALAYGPWRRDRDIAGQLLDELDGIRIHHPFTVTPRPSRLFRGSWWDRDASAIAAYGGQGDKVSRPDVVLAHFMVPDGPPAIRLARELGVPVAAMAWGDDVHAWPRERPDWRAQLRGVLEEADILLACSRQLATDANAWLAKPRTDWNVVYGGVDLETFFPSADPLACKRRTLPPDVMQRISAGGRVLLTLGQPCVAKGYRELLNAWARVTNLSPEWHLVMAGGDGGDLDIPREISERGIQSSAFWIGPQNPQQVPDLLRGSDGFVLASHNEGLSLSVLEALASGLPTIATNVGGHAEVIAHESEGWLVPPRDVVSLEGALLELMTSVEQRARRSAGARKAAERIGSTRDNAVRLAAVLRASIERNRATRTSYTAQ